MPQITGGSGISSSAQIVDGIIVNADINAAAAIDWTKVNTAGQVLNADVGAGAAIVDTKLATIATAGKVSGAALTSLASIPAGAGIIPPANVVTVTFKNGVTTKNASDASTTQNIAHGLGATPKRVHLIAINAVNNVNVSTSAPCYTETVYNGTTQSSIYRIDATATGGVYESLGNAFMINQAQSGVQNDQTGVVTFDSTNIIITWTKTGSPTGTFNILWDAIG